MDMAEESATGGGGAERVEGVVGGEAEHDGVTGRGSRTFKCDSAGQTWIQALTSQGPDRANIYSIRIYGTLLCLSIDYHRRQW